MNTIILAELIIYLGAMLGIGIYFGRKDMSQSDFLLGGKKLPGWALALSERATGESAWLLLGCAGYVYSSGLSAVWILLGCTVGIFSSWMFLAREFRREAEKYGALTLPGYISAKYHRKGALIRWLSSLIIIFFFTLYVAAQFSGAGKVLNLTFGISITTGIIIAAIIVTVYSFCGGFISVVWTDMVQSLLMILTLVLLPIIAYMKIGTEGLSITTALVSAGGGINSWTGGATGFAIGVLIFNNFSWAFGYLGGQPQLSARWMAMRSEKDTKQGIAVGMIWTIIAYCGVFCVGLTGLTLYGPNAVADSEMILPFMMMDLLPSWLAGLLLAGTIAAMMSTADSQLLVATASVSEDIIHKSLDKNYDAKKQVMISRISLLCIALVAIVLAFSSKSLIYTIVGWAWAGVGCSFSPVVILSFFWKKFSSAGAFAGLLVGFVSTVIWMNTLDSIITTRAMTFIFAFLAAVIFSFIFPENEDTSEMETTK